MASLEITRVDVAGDADGELLGSELELPTSSCGFSLKLAGWALRPEGPPRRVRILAVEPLGDGRTLQQVLVTTPPNAPSPQAASRFHDVPGSERSGFNTACSLVGVPREFRLHVEAGFEASRPVTVAHVEGRRRSLRTGYEPRFQPIQLRTVGRAGSTWVTQVIGAHPQALAYRPFDYEPRMLDYWLEILRTLSHPHTYAQAINPDLDGVRAWWEGRRGSLEPLGLNAEPAVERWVEEESIEELAAFAQRRIDSFYRSVAESQDKHDAVRFVERCHEWQEMVLARELYDQLGTVFLVRDLRDLLASRLAFNRKTGTRSFGYKGAATPEEYVHGTMRAEVEELFQSWLAQRADAFLLRYEDLMLRPEETLGALFAHLSMDAGEQTVASVLEGARERAPDRQALHKTSGEAASIGRWRGDLTPALQDACAEAFDVPLTAFGYEPVR